MVAMLHSNWPRWPCRETCSEKFYDRLMIYDEDSFRYRRREINGNMKLTGEVRLEMSKANDLITRLRLEPHPEGGHYREVYRHLPQDGGRGAVTTIYFLLKRGEVSKWHRIDADEIWHHYDGAALELSIAVEGVETEILTLGKDIDAGEAPVHVVPAHAWQAAKSSGDWTLVGCTVAPAFDFTGFEMADDGWEP